MKTLKVTLVALVSIVLFSCEKDSTEEQIITEETPTAKVDFGFTETNINNNYKLFIENNRLNRVAYSTGHTENFIYNSNNQVEQIEFNKPNGELLYKVDFYYTNSILDYSEKQFTGYNSKEKDTYTYSGNITSISSESINLTTNQVQLTSNSSLEIDSNNLISENGSNGAVTYQYDNNSNIFSNLAGLKELIIYYKKAVNPRNLSKNNVNAIDSVNSSMDYNFENQYDNSNRIIQKKQLKTNGDLYYIEKISYN
ncbi:MAG: hypothetical protein HC854_08870 [Flavobacterium sp.]|nr:hypothetical protein [Flavobacterium sp.]